MAKNVLIIKGADFSANKVETIELVDEYVFNINNLLYLDKKLQVRNDGTMITNASNYGGFIDAQNFGNRSIKVENDDGSTYVAYIKDVDFNAKTMSFCTGTSLVSVLANDTYNGTIPSDCDYVYVYIHNPSGDKATEARVYAPILQ